MTDDLRVQLLARLADWSDLPPYGCLPPVQREAVVDALLPVVEAHGRASAATALRDVQSLLWPGRETHIRQDELRRALRGEP